jgi:peptidoglycan/xylan/chitin deacetylase (PgdA/CDA1 family)
MAGLMDSLLKRKNKLFILCYHAVGNDDWKFAISKQTIEKQMKFLLKSYNLVTLDEIENLLNKRVSLTKPSFAITFDDGYKDNLELIPLFKKLNIKPTLFILGNPKIANRFEMDNGRKLLNEKDISLLKKSGWNIQNHGMTHSYLPTESNLDFEINQSKGQSKYIAYPKGGYNDEVIKMVKKSGYKMALTMDSGFITKKTDKFKVPRIGVDKSHSMFEFRFLFSPSVVFIRAITMPLFNFLAKFKK